MSNNLAEFNAIPKPDEAVIISAQSALAQVQDIKVVTPSDYEVLATLVKDIKGRWVAIDEERKKLKRPIDAAASAVQNFFKAPLDALQRAEVLGKNKMAVYFQAQQRLQREEQAKADAKARAERDRLEARAAVAAEKGQEEKAQALQDSANAVVAPAIVREPPSVSGVSTRTIKRFEIVDESLLPREYLVPDEKKIRGVVAALGFDAHIPGVRVYEDTIIAARS
jgi:hypothetical protein